MKVYIFSFCMRKHILDKYFWCLKHSQKSSSPPNRTPLCSFCATEWKALGLRLSCCWLVLLPRIWKFPFPSSTLSVCPEEGNQDARRSSCFTDIPATCNSNNSAVIISQQGLWKMCVFQHPFETWGAPCLDDTSHTQKVYGWETGVVLRHL